MVSLYGFRRMCGSPFEVELDEAAVTVGVVVYDRVVVALHRKSVLYK